MRLGFGARALRQFAGARGIMGTAICALLILILLASGGLISNAHQIVPLRPHYASIQAPRPDPRGAGQWFQLSHLNNQRPAANARAAALAQAAKLPRSALGSKSGRGASPTSPGIWTPLGPQALDTSGCAATQNCTNYGLNSGRITALAVDPTNNNDVWVGAADGGVWHSTDGGASWAAESDSQSSLSVGSMTIDPNSGSPYTVYVGTGEANFNADAYWGVGILKSADGGATWSQLGLQQFGGLGIGKIAILDPDPNNGNHATILVATAFDGTTSPPTGAGGGVDNGLYDNMGIWRSLDGGTTWTQVLHNTTNSPNGFDAGTEVAFDAHHPGIAYAGLGNTMGCPSTANNPICGGSGFASIAGIYASSDSGATWTRAADGLVSNNVERVSLGLAYDSTSTPGKVLTHLFGVISDSGLSASPGSGLRAAVFGDLYDTVYNTSTGAVSGNVYVSLNGGQTWTARNVVGSGSSIVANDDSTHQWWYDNYAVGDPTDSTGNTAYLGGVDVWKTSNLGSSWTNLTNAYGSTPAQVHPDQHALAFFAANSTHPSYFYLGNDGGVWAGTGASGTASFTNLNGHLNITQFYSGSVGNLGGHAQLYGGAQDNGEDQYPAGGTFTGPLQWSESLGGDGGNTLVDFTNNAVIYGEFPHGYPYRSTNGGLTWSCLLPTAGHPNVCQKLTGTSNWVTPFVMAPSNHNELLMGTDRLYWSLNGGVNWSQIGPFGPSICGVQICDYPISAIAVAPSDSNYVYVGLDSSNLEATSNFNAPSSYWYGGYLSSADPTAIVTSIAVDPTNPRVAYATYAGFRQANDGNHLFKTTDAGQTWLDVSLGLPDVPFDSVVVDPNNSSVIVAGSDAGIFVSEDGGNSWQQLGTGLPNAAVDQIFMNHSGTQLYVATHGRGMWTLTFPEIQATPAGINVTAAPSTTPSQESFVLSNSGFGSLNWNQSAPLPAWINTVSPPSGTLAAGQSQTVTVTFNALAPSAQTYSTNLTFTDVSGSTLNSPFNVPVTVVAAPGSKTWYFAEGYTGGNATEYLTIANPNTLAPAHVTVTYLLGNGAPINKQLTISPSARFTEIVNNDVGPGQNVSMVVTADVPIVAERPYYVTYLGAFGSLPSGTDVLGATSLATQFDFGYLDTTANHDTWLTTLNPQASSMTMTIKYFPADMSTPIQIVHTIPANSRGTVYVNAEVGLPAGVYSALVTLSQPGLVERPLYQLHDSVTGYPGAADVIGVPQLQTSWYFAEGFTSPTVNERYILANPTTTTANLTLTFYFSNGSSFPDVRTLKPGQQIVVNANYEIGSNQVQNSAVVTSDSPILAERFMSFDYFGNVGVSRTAHIVGASEVLGASSPSHLAQFAEGYTGGQVAEYLTIDNPNQTTSAVVTVNFLPANGAAPTVRTYSIAPHTRFTLYTNPIMPGQWFAMTVESSVAVVAERPMYFIYNGFAPGGTNVVGYQPPGS